MFHNNYKIIIISPKIHKFINLNTTYKDVLFLFLFIIKTSKKEQTKIKKEEK